MGFAEMLFRDAEDRDKDRRAQEPGRRASDLKETNPKDAIGAMKVPLHLVSGVVKAFDALSHFLGNVKYGAWNYRAGGARASVYYAALQRHMDRWWEGEELDPVDGTPHLANAKACLNILIETQYGGNLIDDRPPSRDLNPLYRFVERCMANIRERYADKNPRHYTIADTDLRLTGEPSPPPAYITDAASQ